MERLKMEQNLLPDSEEFEFDGICVVVRYSEQPITDAMNRIKTILFECQNGAKSPRIFEN